MLELTINGKNCDTAENITVEYTRQIAKIGEISNRTGDFTTQVKIPLTANNRNIVGNSHIIGSTSNFAQVFQQCTLKSHGERIFENGLALLDRFEDNEYYFRCFGSMISLSKKWDGELARDLFMPELDTVLSVAAINSENNTWEQGFIFPHIYWEEPHTTFLLRPCLFAAYVFRKLFESEGYTLDTNIFNDLLFTRSILPFNGENVEYGKRKFEEAFFEVSTGAGSFTETQSLSGTETVLVNKGIISTFVIIEAGRFEFDAGFIGLNETFVSGDENSSATVTVEYQKNGVPFTGFTDCLVGDIITAHAIARFDIYSDPLAPVAGGGTLTASWAGAFLKLKNVSTTITLTDEIHFEQVLPKEWTKLDLFKSIVQTFGLLVDIDNVTRKAKIFFFKELYDNKNSAYNWTEKLSGGIVSMEYHAVDYGKLNAINWKTDEVSGLNNYNFSISDESLQEFVELFELPFACSAEKNNIAVITQFRNGEFEEREQRILYVEKIGAAYPTGRFLDFSLAPYYSDLANGMLKKYRKIEVDCRLFASDVFTYDFSRPIYLEQFSDFFFCESLQAFTTSDELTTVNLVRL